MPAILIHARVAGSRDDAAGSRARASSEAGSRGSTRLRPAAALAGSRRSRRPARRADDRRASTAAASTCYSAAARDTLLVHLGMTGSLRVHARPPQRRAHDHVDIEFETAPRCATTTRAASGRCCWSPAAADRHPLLRDLGPEPLPRRSTPLTFGGPRAAERAAIKLALMDNRLVVGVGNIYANEALFRAGIRPTTPAGRLSRPAARPAGRRDARRAPRGDRQGRQHAARLRRCRRGSRATSSSTIASMAAADCRAASAAR